jgi:hypothetical protein
LILQKKIINLKEAFVIKKWYSLPTISYTPSDRLNIKLVNGEVFEMIVGQNKYKPNS